MTRRTRVYIAGPIAKGNTLHNVHTACSIWKLLWDEGYAPYCPHWDCIQDMISPMEVDKWMEHDYIWLSLCDAVLRLPGDSVGADKECLYAKVIGLPVFYSKETLLDELAPTRET